MTAETTDLGIGQRVRALRADNGWSQGQLLEQLRARGLSWAQSTISKVEAGERPVRLTEASRLVEVFGLDSVDALFPEQDILDNLVDELSDVAASAAEQAATASRNARESLRALRAVMVLATAVSGIDVEVPESVSDFLGAFEGATLRTLSQVARGIGASEEMLVEIQATDDPVHLRAMFSPAPSSALRKLGELLPELLPTLTFDATDAQEPTSARDALTPLIQRAQVSDAFSGIVHEVRALRERPESMHATGNDVATLNNDDDHV